MSEIKTGDVRRLANWGGWHSRNGEWAVLDGSKVWCVVRTRDDARCVRMEGHRIARVLSIGPKLITVRAAR
jgi:hypothetical protein